MNRVVMSDRKTRSSLPCDRLGETYPLLISDGKNIDVRRSVSVIRDQLHRDLCLTQ